jgi:dihydroorotase
MKYLLQNAMIFLRTEKKFCIKDVLIENKVIAQISDKINCNADRIINLNQKLLLPGFVDMQVHLRVPGQEYKEDLESGTMAAHRGGFTAVACMPNTVPTLDHKKILEDFFSLTQNSKLDIYPIPAMTLKLEGKSLANYEDYKSLGIIGITDDGKGVQDDLLMEEIFKQAAKYQLTIFQHCEYESISNHAPLHLGPKSLTSGISGQSGLAESKMIERDLNLLKKYGGHYHALHLSAKESILLIKKAKREGLNVTCEVTPHHLTLIDEDIPGLNTNYKMNPPLRGKDDWEALVENFSNGLIDIVSTDHAPHAEFEKERNISEAPFGVIGLETAFPVIYSKLVKTNQVSLIRLIEALCYRPREIFNLPKRDLMVGLTADLTCIDLENFHEVKNFASKSKNSPFIGQNLIGFPSLTLYQGEIVFEELT